MITRLIALSRDSVRQDQCVPAPEDWMAESEAMANSFEHVAQFFQRQAASLADWAESPRRSERAP